MAEIGVIRRVCRMKRLDGTPCENIATHYWGSVLFCCDHFDEFIIAMFDLAEAVATRRHHDLVSYFERQTKRNSAIRNIQDNASEDLGQEQRKENDNPVKLPDK